MSKILLLTPSYSPADIGACARRVGQLSKSLSTHGYKVWVITGSNIEFGKREKSVSQVYFPQKNKNQSLVQRLWQSTWFCLKLLRFIPQVWRFKPDWIWVQAPPWPLPVLGLLFQKLTGAKLLLNCSDLHPQALADMGKVSKSSLIYRWSDRIATYFYRRADLLSGQSEEILTTFATCAPQTPRVLYRNGVLKVADTAKKAPKKKIRWVYLGSLNEAQDLLTWVKTLDFSPQSLHIYGTGTQREALQAYLKAHPEKEIFLYAPVTPTEVLATLQKYDAAIITQRQALYGTVPSKLYEALAAALPVLALGEGELARLVEESRAGVAVSPKNKSEAQDALRWFQGLSPESYETLSAHARNYAQKKLRHHSQFQRFIDRLNRF